MYGISEFSLIILMEFTWLSEKCYLPNLAPINGLHPISRENNRDEGEGMPEIF